MKHIWRNVLVRMLFDVPEAWDKGDEHEYARLKQIQYFCGRKLL